MTYYIKNESYKEWNHDKEKEVLVKDFTVYEKDDSTLLQRLSLYIIITVVLASLGAFAFFVDDWTILIASAFIMVFVLLSFIISAPWEVSDRHKYSADSLAGAKRYINYLGETK